MLDVQAAGQFAGRSLVDVSGEAESVYCPRPNAARNDLVDAWRLGAQTGNYAGSHEAGIR